ncbi:MAG: hypothetical protein M1834_009729 [Cirrosporium novae-zelandiae]|nr:MAG: hypothetical protein M1834_009729 [Cirrosporium novae-zelandiae]
MSATNSSNVAAMAAAVKGNGEGSLTFSTGSHRRSLTAKKGLEFTSLGGISGFRAFSPQSPDKSDDDSPRGSAITDGLASIKEHQTKPRNRRASEGSHLIKGEVQILQAATALETMRLSSSGSPDGAKNFDSDHSSASPEASGSSEYQEEEEEDEDFSSAETTPPPYPDEPLYSPISSTGFSRKHRSSSSAYSNSYQSHSPFIGSAPNASTGFAHFQLMNEQPRIRADDEASLAAESLCSFGTPRLSATRFSSDVPPVPKVPEHFLSQSARPMISSGNSFTNSFFSPLDWNPPMKHKLSEVRDVKMSDGDLSHDHENSAANDYRAQHDDDDDMIVGRMEE